MPVTFFVDPRRLPSWSPWSEWLESGARREPRCLWLRRPAVKRGPELPLQLQGPGGKRVCCRPAAESDGYRQVVDVAGYRPDEVRVRLSADGQVTVSACHRERSDTGFSHSRMVRRLSLPQHVRADQLSSRWTPAGQLVLEAPAAEPSERCGRCPHDQRKVMVVPVTYDTPAVKEGQDKTAEEGEKTEESRTEKTCTDQEEVQGEQAHEGEAEQSDGPDVAVDVEAAAEDKENPEMSSESAENPTEKSQDDVRSLRTMSLSQLRLHLSSPLPPSLLPTSRPKSLTWRPRRPPGRRRRPAGGGGAVRVAGLRVRSEQRPGLGGREQLPSGGGGGACQRPPPGHRGRARGEGRGRRQLPAAAGAPAAAADTRRPGPGHVPADPGRPAAARGARHPGARRVMPSESLVTKGISSE